ncbi:hypothetical protein HNP37_001034 [Flavobacterium nitrogenifigens]|uniref:Uncharacterized protein n=2 Tax=Flavobacterium TaxID=237 RepID=A0A7W7IV49_9FLAO|nr:hypothetical protein [Flavobacterium nitrogenifigens]MBB6385257.1 hypothetical protein [Flavobacterium notoginsengisoli]
MEKLAIIIQDYKHKKNASNIFFFFKFQKIIIFVRINLFFLVYCKT